MSEFPPPFYSSRISLVISLPSMEYTSRVTLYLRTAYPSVACPPGVDSCMCMGRRQPTTGRVYTTLGRFHSSLRALTGTAGAAAGIQVLDMGSTLSTPRNRCIGSVTPQRWNSSSRSHAMLNNRRVGRSGGWSASAPPAASRQLRTSFQYSLSAPRSSF